MNNAGRITTTEEARKSLAELMKNEDCALAFERLLLLAKLREAEQQRQARP